ncbi:MAG: hypothetical protein V5A20_05295 [Salinibacter sp.]|uniref:hypothetical protein n=1 Tax=Salinibacter sp. TaxID=2065818 RepID=UPI002FC3A515
MLGMFKAQAQQLNKVDTEFRKQVKTEYHGEKLNNKGGPLVGLGLNLNLHYYEHKTRERLKINSLSRMRESSRSKAWSIDPIENEYVINNSSLWGIEMMEDRSINREEFPDEIKVRSKHVFVSYKFGGGEEYSEGDIVGYGINITFCKKYIIRERAYEIKNGKINIEENKIEEGYMEKKEFENISYKVEEFVSQSPPSRFPDDNEARLDDPSKSLILKIRNNKNKKMSIFKAQMGGDNKYYPEELLNLVNDLENIIYSNIK